MQQSRTYFSQIAGRAWLIVGLFVLAFYLLCFLYSKRYITAGEGGVLLGTYWAASTLYLSKDIYDHFPKFYKAMLRRMRLYGKVRWFLQWQLGFVVMFVPFLYFVLIDYDANVRNSFDNYSVKFLVGAYGTSLLGIVYIYTIICNFVAEARGVRCSK